jgi:hypothetical protein
LVLSDGVHCYGSIQASSPQSPGESKYALFGTPSLQLSLSFTITVVCNWALLPELQHKDLRLEIKGFETVMSIPQSCRGSMLPQCRKKNLELLLLLV